jgi:hypothetical protein
MAVKKSLISYILIGLIAIQIIPIMELRNSLSKNNIAQEYVSDFENEESEEKKNDDNKKMPELFHHVRQSSDPRLSGNFIKHSLKDISFNSRISDDIPTRPPSYFC